MNQKESITDILHKSGKRALGGGISGASAMVLQVGSLMWLRTTMNYQYRYGTPMKESFAKLYKEGGIRRFYRGVGPALIQGPLSRFGDTAANAGVISILDSYPASKNLPIFVKTACSSSVAGLWRIVLMPVDTVKTILQVEGTNGLSILNKKYKTNGIRVFYQGSVVACSATFVGHYPWFYTYNYLSENLPIKESFYGNLCRNAVIGFSSSVVSDCSSNSLRILKTVKQSSDKNITYRDSVKLVVSKDGIYGLFFRGIKTRILANGLQSILFTIAFKAIQEKIN